LRTVFETEQFGREKLIISRDPKRVDRILQDSIYYTLSRDPLRGKQTSNPNVWMLLFYPSPLAGFVVYYSFSDTHVALVSVTREEDEAFREE
jgi:hypothetical protein